MGNLHQTLDQARGALKRSVDTVRKSPPAPTASHNPNHGTLRPRRSDTAKDQSIAALQAVVWIASFVQSVFNEITGQPDDF